MFKKLLKDEEGATAVEYGLIAVFIAVGIIAALTTLRESLTGLYSNIATQITSNQ
jgi:pilus assembly protein Flp/PilA